MAGEATPQQEPSMEEILASIRRIISEDDVEAEEGGEQPAEAATDNGILDLTEMVAEEPEPEPEPESEPEPEPESVLGLREPEPEPEQPLEMPALEPAPEEVKAPPVDADRLLSKPTSNVSARAFTDLAFALDEGGRRAGQSTFPLGDGDRTVEDLVRELLRPMLRNWLDANLPDLVQRLVRKELKEMVRRAEDH